MSCDCDDSEEKESGIPELKEYAFFEIGKRRKQKQIEINFHKEAYDIGSIS